MNVRDKNTSLMGAVFRRIRHGLLAALFLPSVLAVQLPAAPVPAADKISSVILTNRDAKRQPADLSPAAHRRDLLKRGLDADNLSGEACTLYADRPLTPDAIMQLAALGITVTPDLWIPPVAGRHAQGFHLATVGYDSLDVIRNDPRFTRLESVEFRNKPLNDLSISMIQASAVHTGSGVAPYTGAGIAIAVADSGLDVSHADFPAPVESFDLTTGTSPATWSTTVANTVSAHGTHVTGSVLGRGTLSGGKYRGSAPGADLFFYKIGDNVTGSASDTDIIEAVNRAVTAGARVFTLSYGGFSTYMDGSEAVEQAIDAAVAAGVTVFAAAGNDASAGRHDSVSVPPATTSDSFGFTIVNDTGDTYRESDYIRIIWRDNAPGDFNITLTCTNLSTGTPPKWNESLALESSSVSTRGTESRLYRLTPNLAAGTQKTYWLQLQNSASGGDTPLVHGYQIDGIGTFNSPDPAYTVGHPAVADTAIAVGAWTQRKYWTDWKGSTYYFLPGETVGTRSSFSSLGPRIDGLRKPDIVAPGTATLSARDSVPGLASTDALIIDSDGVNLNGSGPADYYVMQGTSMACPMAAGVAALLLQSNPGLTPAQVRTALTGTASRASTPDNLVGSGLIDARAAVRQVTSFTLTVVSEHGGVHPGTVTTNGGAALSQWITNSPLAVGAATQHVCLVGTVLGNAYTQAAATNVTLTLTNNATLTWAWQTQYRLTVETNGSGSVTGMGGWLAAGVSTSLTAVAAPYWHFTGWSGDTGGCSVADNLLTADMTRARTVEANFAANVAPQGTPEHWLAGYGLTNASFAEEEQMDRDGDGMYAWEEYVADTDPTDPASVLAFTGLRLEGSTVRLDWKGGQWARQYLDERADLAASEPSWMCVLTNAALPTSVTNFTLRPDAAGPGRFYRIRVER